MTWHAPEVHRVPAPHTSGEREMLEGWLDYHRQTLLSKCTGLDAEQLKLATAPPSTLTLLGLVRHMAEVERWWFRSHTGPEPLAHIYCTEQSPDGDFDDIATADAPTDFATYLAECELARAAASTLSLDQTFFNKRRETKLSLRWIYLHMIEEYARHNGHADLLRERTDGVTGV
jgi:uncharacterized damage-inducible protein DinB